MGLIISAPNVHLGGGNVLLCALLETLGEESRARLIVDKRMSLPESLPLRFSVNHVRPTIWGRLLAEWHLRKWTGTEDTVLCFGNLPPLFRLRGKVLLFIQNRYLVESRSLNGFPLSNRLRITMERLWFAWGKRNVTHLIVQTPSMQRTVELNLRMPCTILPFSKEPKGYIRAADAFQGTKQEARDFLYVASGEPHKNHRHLVEAWILLAEEGIRPGLCLTLDKKRFADLWHWIDERVKHMRLNITNVGSIAARDLGRIYRESVALIYPSDFESFGLPLIEARSAGLPVLASEKDYVRDVIDPEESFDPDSPVSIARAVKRFMGIRERPLPLMDAKEFLSKVYEIACA